ncbi:MAG: Gfo/Idh/MocA family oxidoreductase [Caldilineaceae bacterium]
MATEVGIGVVGSGLWASTVHLPAYQAHPRARLVGIYDVDRAGAARAAKQFGIEAVFSDYHALLARADIDAIDIITPNVTHVALTLAAIAAGKHVICEKPMAMNGAEAQQMADAAAKANCKTAINFTWRNPPAVQYMRHLIEQERIGKIYHVQGIYRAGWGRNEQRPIEWRLQQKFAGTGVLGDIGSHLIDMVEWLTGERITSLVADLNTFQAERPLADGSGMGVVDVDDAVSFLARLSGGGMATFLATFYGTGERMNQGVEIFGQKGALKMEYTNQATIRAALEPFDGDYNFIDLPIPDHFKTAGWDLRQNTVRRFVDAIADDEAMTPGFEDGLRNQRIIDTVVASAREGKWLAVPA